MEITYSSARARYSKIYKNCYQPILTYVLGLLAVAHAAVSGHPAPPQPATPQIKLGGTTLTGRDITGLQLDFFGGIPFAEPPLGKLRLKPPVLKTKLDGKTFDASNFGLGCLQGKHPSASFSEDCLTINVYRPRGLKSNAKLPVLFWTYGGGFDAGEASIYNGSAIVAQSVARGTPVVYVNFNYRLGPLGFPQGQEAANRGALNLALKDQLAALEWVQANIETFGGDKKKVTAFGESAGAIMTAVLFLNSPLDKLARAVILESGSAATALEFNAARREIDWQNFVSGVSSCASLATSGNTFDCLMAANSSDIFTGLGQSLAEAPELFGFDPTIDGPGGLFPDIASNLIKVGHFARLPFIAGTNLDEGTDFTSKTLVSTEDIRENFITSYSPPLVNPDILQATADRLLELYPDIPALGSPFNTGNETFGLDSGYKRAAALNGDLSFQSQRRSWIQAASGAGVKTFGYLFTQPQPNGNPNAGVSHGSEVPFVYGAPSDTSASALRISILMIDYWVSFATSLDPNDGHGTPRPNWPQYTPKNQVLLQLNGANTTVIPDDYRKEQIDFINSDPAVYHHRRALKFN
ncbi:extracellular triacylglycerol lipase precursor [Phlegmacium glaucopus]|nr:extracellular triacylglycerol lipase precursor [Phlegmacium glaucopus]